MAARKIGLTGGIGSGKSTVARILGTLGVPLFYSDDEAKKLHDTDPDVRKAVDAAFSGVRLPDGRLDRAALAKQVFNDPAALARLNAIMHPAVRAAFRTWHELHVDAPYVVNEAALLVEVGSFREMDALVVVTAPEDLRVARVVARDGVPEAQVRARMAAQLPTSALVAHAQHVVVNDGRPLLEQVLALHEQLRRPPTT